MRELPSNIPSRTSITINEDDDDSMPSVKSFDRSGFFRDSGEREPLLADNGDSNRSSYLSDGSNEGVRFPSLFNRSHSQYKAS